MKKISNFVPKFSQKLSKLSNLSNLNTKFLNFKSIRTKIFFGFSIVLILSIIMASVNFSSVSTTNHNTEKIVNEELPTLISYDKLSYNISQRSGLVLSYILYDNNEDRKLFNQFTGESKDLQESILATNPGDDVKALFDKSIEWERIIINEVFKQASIGNDEAALQIMTEKVQPLSKEITDGFNSLANAERTSITESGENMISAGGVTVTVSVVLSILVIILSIAVALYTSKVIVTPIRSVMNRMKLIANGDLNNEPIVTNLKDETGELIRTTNEMNRSMRELLLQIDKVSKTVSFQSDELSNSANEVMSSSEQIAITMQDLASGSELQANNSSELAAMMGDFTEKINEANSNGQHVQQSSKNVLAMTNEGSQLMASSSKQMEKIDQIIQGSVQKVQELDTQSKEISKLVSVIKNIAEQTNLLALNASIEAARAGEHGRGFAVVANEVRVLSEQVAASVKDITKIVTGIQSEVKAVTESLNSGYKEVKEGTNEIKLTEEKFNAITASVNEMVGRIQTISSNLAVITANSQEMNSSIQDIAAIAEESAAGIEQTSAAAQQSSSTMESVAQSSNELAALSEELKGLINQFKL